MALKEELLSLAPAKNPLLATERMLLERSLAEAFGREGMLVYAMLDGRNTVRRILAETGIPEGRLLSILALISENRGADIKPVLLTEDLFAPPTQAPAPSPSEKAGVTPALRSRSEKKVFDRFGPKGLEAYRLMDSTANPGEIMEKLGIGEVEMLSIMQFLQDEGIIAFEMRATEAPKPASRLRFPEARQPQGQKTQALVPAKAKSGLLDSIKLQAELLRRFGPAGKAVYEGIDGKASTVKLAKNAHSGFSTVDSVLAYLTPIGAVTSRELSHDEVKEKYGEEGTAIYDVYGREGLLVYELIDKKMTIREIVRQSGVTPRLGIEMLEFIHKILGVQIPFDAKSVMAALEQEEKGKAQKK